MKLSQFVVPQVKPVSEAMNHNFDDIDEIKIDPDRDGSWEVVDQLLPTIAKIAYSHLMGDKNKHERTHGPKSDEEDAYNFRFDTDALVEMMEEINKQIADRLHGTTTARLKDVIQSVSKSFKEKLDETK